MAKTPLAAAASGRYPTDVKQALNRRFTFSRNSCLIAVMTIKARNTVFISCFAAIAVFFVFFLASGGMILYRITPKPSVKSFFDPADPLFNLTAVFISLIYCLTAGIIFLRSFRKTSSAEIFFFFIFLTLTAVESLKVLTFWVDYFSLPFEGISLVSRVVYSAHIMAALCLFASGLFACGLQYQRLEAVLGICFLVTLFMAPLLPLDTSARNSNLLFALGLQREFLLTFLVVGALGVCNYIYAASLNSNSSYHLMALGMAMVIAGKELLFFSPGLPQMLAGFVVLSGGTYFFGSRTHEIYLWF